MEAAESFEIALQYIVFAHDLGEANHNKIQFWIGTSYVLLIAAYVAPQRMSIGITTLLLTLYIAFSAFTYTVMNFDGETAHAAVRDALRVAELGNVQVESVIEKMRGQEDDGLKAREAISSLFGPGLFLGVIGFVCIVAFKNWRNRPGMDQES